MKDIKIDGLNLEQMLMLEIMWTIDTVEEFNEWIETLDRDQVRMALTLKEVLVAHVLDDIDTYDTAKKYLDKFRLTK
jgi:hypothetical protein